MITLIIVDYQNDYITGTMAIKNARNSVEETKKFVKNHCGEIDKIIFAVDWHQYNHQLFKKYGGSLPFHCVQYTPGACIEPKFLKLIQGLNLNYEIDPKGQWGDNQAFEEIEYYQSYPKSKYYFDTFVSADPETDFVITGRDVSTMVSIKNLSKESIYPKVFMPGIISSDGCKTFSSFIKENELEKTT